MLTAKIIGFTIGFILGVTIGIGILAFYIYMEVKA